MTNHFILQLYGLARECPRDQFGAEFVRLLGNHIEFESGFVAHGKYVPDEEDVIPYEGYAENIDPAFLNEWATIIAVDPLVPFMMACPGKVVSISVKKFYSNTPEYAALGDKYEIRSITALLNRQAGGVEADWFSYARSDSDAVASSAEHQWLDIVSPHIWQAFSINRVIFPSAVNTAAAGRAMAAADPRSGALLVDDGFFSAILRKEWSDFDGRLLPGKLRSLLRRPGPFHFKGNHVYITGSYTYGIALLTARKGNLADALTPRQLEIARQYSVGRTNKEIGKETGLSPATIRNHMAAVYATLCVHTKKQLVEKLAAIGDPQG